MTMNWPQLWNYDFPKESKREAILQTIREIQDKYPGPNIRKTAIVGYLHGVLDGLDNLNIQIIRAKIEKVATK
jgi:hypothetical protein